MRGARQLMSVDDVGARTKQRSRRALPNKKKTWMHLAVLPRQLANMRGDLTGLTYIPVPVCVPVHGGGPWTGEEEEGGPRR